MTWRELVFEICHKIPDEQFDDEAKIVLNSHVFGIADELHQNKQDWYSNIGEFGIVSEANTRKDELIIKKGEWTIE